MKRNTVFYFMIFIIMFGLTSCATDPLLRGYIVGSWQPSKFGRTDPQKLLDAGEVMEDSQYTMEDQKMLDDLKHNLIKPDAKDTLQRSIGDEWTIMVNEINTSYMFSSEGSGSRLNPDHPLKGTWKLNKKGKKLVLTGFDKKDQFILLIDSLSSNKMVATNKNLPNGLKITYLKNK